MKSLYRIVSDIRKCFRLDDSVVDSETGEVFDAGYLDQLKMKKEAKEPCSRPWMKQKRS
jgi:hypothetical protein